MNKLRVWWIPQVPGKCFVVDVASVSEDAKLIGVLARYDAFQLANHIAQADTRHYAKRNRQRSAKAAARSRA